MSDPVVDLDRATYEQVAKLLGADRAAQMLDLLHESIVKICNMNDAELIAPSGLSLVHRLKSEAGLMGFERLSRSCATIDTASVRDRIDAEDLTKLREATSASLIMIENLGKYL